MNKEIQIVNRGRGLQLSTSRVRVQDLVPYFREGCSHDEIVRWIPSLTEAEICVVENYYRDHKVELDAQDQRIRDIETGRTNPAWIEQVAAEARAERKAMVDKLSHVNGDDR